MTLIQMSTQSRQMNTVGPATQRLGAPFFGGATALPQNEHFKGVICTDRLRLDGPVPQFAADPMSRRNGQAETERLQDSGNGREFRVAVGRQRLVEIGAA